MHQWNGGQLALYTSLRIVLDCIALYRVAPYVNNSRVPVKNSNEK